MNGLFIHCLERNAIKISLVPASNHDYMIPKHLEQTRRILVLFVEIHFFGSLKKHVLPFYVVLILHPSATFFYNGVGRQFYSSSLSLPSLKSIPALFVGLLFAISLFITIEKGENKQKNCFETQENDLCYLTS